MTKKTAGAKVLAFDLGGTKIAVGAIDAQGKVLEEIREPALFAHGKEAVLGQMVSLGTRLLATHRGIKRIGVASAGPLDPERGVLLDPTNFASEKGHWGKTPISAILRKQLKLPVSLENDAASAILAEHWIGAARKVQNAMVLTLGTGLGTGILCNGELVRAGQQMHTEAGHLILNATDVTAPCGCGNLGCAEAYLSGRNFSRRARARFGDPTLDAKAIAQKARARDPRALAAFDEYAQYMALAIHNYAVIYAPELVVFTGSFADASDLFLDATQRKLEPLLVRRRDGVDFMPRFAVSTLHNQAGLIGAAYVAMRKPSGRLTKN